MPPPPPTEGTAPLERLAHLRDTYGALPRARRELVIFGLALLCGLIVMPFLIWFAGSRVLGPYTHGQNAHAGPFALVADFFLGLLHGSAVFWAVALGPAVLLLLIRLFVALVRALPASGGDGGRRPARPCCLRPEDRGASLRPVHPHRHGQHGQGRPMGGEAPGALAQLPVEAAGRGRRK